jgi:hypothetical protein
MPKDPPGHGTGQRGVMGVLRRGSLGTLLFALLLGVVGQSRAQTPASPASRAHLPAPRKPRATGAAVDNSQRAMSVTTWFYLGDDPAKPSLIRAKPGLYAAPADDASENIFVFSRRNRAQEEQWWPESKSGLPLYESSNSDAAQPLVPYASWTSPEQQRLTSSIKDAMGACGVFMITCPNPAP